MQNMSSGRQIAALTLVFASIAFPLFASIQYKIDDEKLTPLSGPLASGAKVRLERIPIDGDWETLELERFEVFAADADIKVLGANDEILARLSIPAIRTYRGSIAGDPDSSVFLAVGPARIDGIVFRGDRRFGIGSRPRTHQQRARESEGIDVFIQESDVLDDMPANGKGFFCDADQATLPRIPTRVVTDGLIPGADGTLSTPSARWAINLAVETDYELYVNVGSSSGNVTTFITNLIGAMSTIYDRELTTEVSVASLTINSSVADPFTVVPGASGDWNGSTILYTTTHALLKLGDRWHNSPPSHPRRMLQQHWSSAKTSMEGSPGSTGWERSISSSTLLNYVREFPAIRSPMRITMVVATASTARSLPETHRSCRTRMPTLRPTRLRLRTIGLFFRSRTRPDITCSADTPTAVR